jgi:hypothetical protein
MIPFLLIEDRGARHKRCASGTDTGVYAAFRLVVTGKSMSVFATSLM